MVQVLSWKRGAIATMVALISPLVMGVTAAGAAPVNDAFASATHISGLSGTANGTNVAATKQTGEPDHAGNPGGASIWYVWTAPSGGVTTFDTCGSSFDTLLGVYTGTALTALTEEASNDDSCATQSSVSFTATSGTTYRIAIDGFNAGTGAATGTTVLHWAHVDPPPNDNFANAQTISGASGTVNGTNVAATKEAGEPDHAGAPGGVSIWYAWTAPTSGLFTFDTCGASFDTTLAIYTGDTVASLTPEVADDDTCGGQSRVTLHAVAATTYHIAIDGFDASSNGPTVLQWAPGHISVDDFDGDARTDLAVYRPSNGTWFVKGQSSTAWGGSSDLPVPGDYDGDGTTDIAVYRPSSGTWYVLPSSGGGSTATTWGTGSDVPVPGDYDGDGKTDIAVYRPSSGTWYVLPSSGGGPTATTWGTGSDVPVPGDYDGDGKTDVAVYRPSSGTWYIRGSAGTVTATVWGAGADVPEPGDYDRDGKTDLAVYRPSNGTWYIRGSAGTVTATAWGAGADVPLALPPAIRKAYF